MLVIILIMLAYIHIAHFGKRIIGAAKQQNLDKLKRIRKRSKLVSIANLFLMTVVILLSIHANSSLTVNRIMEL